MYVESNYNVIVRIIEILLHSIKVIEINILNYQPLNRLLSLITCINAL